MIAAVGLGWFKDFQECAKQFVHRDQVYQPISANVKKYAEIYAIYHQVYEQTKQINHELQDYKKQNNI